MDRGLLIVFEGVDGSGKTTESKKLVESLLEVHKEVEYIAFPDRTTETGKLIDKYLKNKVELDDKAVHLLFSANRWEKSTYIAKKLDEGVHVVVDRYMYSGIAYTAAKGYDIWWSRNADQGLPIPDIVFYLETPRFFNKKESEFENPERYENYEFLEKVKKCYNKLMTFEEPYLWLIISENEKDRPKIIFNTIKGMM